MPMPATHYVDAAARLIITLWVGDAVDTELIDAIRHYQSELQTNPDYADYNEVVNFLGVESIQVTPKGLASVGKIAATTDARREGGKVAMIVKSGLAFNLARMYASLRNASSSKEIRIFQDEGNAFAWAQSVDEGERGAAG